MGEKGTSSGRITKLSMTGAGMTVLLVSIVIAIAFTSLAVTPVMAQEEAKVTVMVNAPEYVGEKETFDVTIEVNNIEDFNAGQFDLTFDHKVVEVKKVSDGSIDDTEIPITMWDEVDSDTIRVFPELSGVETVSGSGYLALIKFKVKGDEGEGCVLDISGKLVKLVEQESGAVTPEKMSIDGISAEITVGTGGGGDEEEEPPEITAVPEEAVVSSTEGEPMDFEITVDHRVDISWQINGTEVQKEEDVTGSFFTKSAEVGTWNVSVIATSTETGLSSMHTWIWSVTPTETEAPEETPTPTPTLAPEGRPTPAPTLAPGETPLREATPAVKPTPKPTAPPEKEPTPTPESGVPGFEAVFAIAMVIAVAYILRRKRREMRDERRERER